jgi:hypothetical protein
VTPLKALNPTFNTVLAPLSQNGIDSHPAKRNRHVGIRVQGLHGYGERKAMLDESFFAFNSQLTKSNLPPLKIGDGVGPCLVHVRGFQID